jgi:hypothetical protein
MKQSDNTDRDKVCLIYKVAKQWGYRKKITSTKENGYVLKIAAQKIHKAN